MCILWWKSVQCTLEDKGIEWSDILEDQEGLHRRGHLKLDLEGDFQEYWRRLLQEEAV